MKKFITILGYIASVLSILGMLFKIQHWAGAGPLLIVGFGIFILFFLPSYGYNLIYGFTEKKSKVAAVFGSIFFIIFGAATIFKIQHWPGAGVIFLFQYIFLCLFFLPVLMIVKIKSSSSSKEKMLQFFWYLSLIFVAAGYSFKLFHWPGAAILLILGSLFVAFGYLPLAIKCYNNEEYKGKLYNRYIIIVSGLVFTLVTTMGVNSSIMDSFVSINDGINQTTNYLSINNEKLFSSFKADGDNNAQLFYIKAKKAKDLSDDLYNHIEKLKIDLMNQTNRSTNDSIQLAQVEAKDNYDIPNFMLIGDPENPKTGAQSAMELKAKLFIYKKDLLSLMINKFEGYKEYLNDAIGLNTDDVYSEDEQRKIPWEVETFYHFPIAGVITTLSKIQNDVRIAESIILNVLLENRQANLEGKVRASF